MNLFFCAFTLLSMIAGIQSGGDKFAICDLDMDRGFTCTEKLPKVHFHYNKRLGFCESFILLGCGGNGNRFDNSTYCETFCITQGDARPSIGDTSFPSVTNEPLDY